MLGVVLMSSSANLVTRANVAPRVIGIFALAFFGLCTITMLACLVHPPVVVAFGPEGVSVPVGAFRRCGPVIPWSAIEALRVYRYAAAPVGPGIRMLGVVPTDPADTIWADRRVKRANQRRTGLPLSISGQVVPGELEELAERFRRYSPGLPIEYGEPRNPLWRSAPRRRS